MSAPAIHRDVLPNGLRLLTERMPHVRSVSIGVWLSRGSRHEPSAHEGIAHFVEHMLFKGTATRSAEDIAQQIDSIGGHLDAFTSKEYAGYFIKVLDEHLPLAVDVLSDLVTAPAFDPAEIEREKKVVLEEIKMVEDTPDDLVHEIFAGGFWPNHPLGRPILGQPETVSALDQPTLRGATSPTPTSPRTSSSRPSATSSTPRCAAWSSGRSAACRCAARRFTTSSRSTAAEVVVRSKDLEQSHVCFGTPALAYGDADRYVAFALNTMLGGSMSSRLFQNVRETRGLAYAVFSEPERAIATAGALTIYAGCANESVPELVDVVVQELRRMKRRAAGRRGAAARQGPSEGQPDARAREHVEPDVAPGPPGHLRRRRRVARRDARSPSNR